MKISSTTNVVSFTGLLHQFKFESPISREDLPNINFCEDDVNTGFIRYPPTYEVILRPRF